VRYAARTACTDKEVIPVEKKGYEGKIVNSGAAKMSATSKGPKGAQSTKVTGGDLRGKTGSSK
jgi:hypothetical protein